MDRSVPIGPTFSFPSIPSLPGASIFSFFSWRGWSQQQQERREQGLPEENLQDTAEGIQRGEPMLAESRQQQPPQQSDLDTNTSDQTQQQQQEETNRFISSVNAMFQYFSSSPSNKTLNGDDEERIPSNEPGIITWDPLKDQIQQHHSQQPQLASNDYDDRSQSADQLNTAKKQQRPVMRTRSMTFDQAYPKIHNKRYMDKHMETADNNVAAVPDKKAKHLVEVLGIDGVRMESFERAKQNFRPASTDTAPDIVIEDAQKKPSMDNDEDNGEQQSSSKKQEGEAQEQEEGGESQSQRQEQDPPPHAKLPGGRRIDHVLQPESFMSMIANEYLVGLRAHFSYWTNKDLLWHIVRRLEDLQEATADTSSSKEQKSV